MSNGLRTTFLIRAIVALSFGIVLYLIPDLWANLVNWTPFDAAMTRFMGAAGLAIGVSSWLGYRAEIWKEVRITVQMDIVFTVTGALIGLYIFFTAGGPLFIWVFIIPMVVFAVLWIYFYRQENP
jgi:hypothetical protein